ncbi:MAG: lysophospholipid acyltransferase family protein [Bacillota bacterium]
MKKGITLYGFIQPFLYWLFLGFAFLVKILPGCVSYHLGAGLGTLAFYFLKSRRDLTIDNIRKAQGLPAGTDAVKTAKACFRNLGLTGVEFLRYGWMPMRRRLKMFNVHGEENLKKALEHGRGAIILTFHLGNWELLGALLNLLGHPPQPIVQNQSNKGFDQLVNFYRSKMGMKIIRKGLSLRHMLKAFADNQLVAFLADQHAGKDGITVEFFGRTASTPRGVAAVVEICRPPVIPSYIIRKSFEKHDVYFESPLEMNRDPHLSKEERIHDNTVIITKKAEDVIKKAPEQWLWLHKRWR